MTIPIVLVATWSQGLFVVSADGVQREYPEQSVRGLTPDRRGGVLGILGGKSLCRRSPGGEWRTLADSDFDLACCAAVGAEIYVGTDDAQVLKLGPANTFEPLPGFATVPGRDSWYAGTAVINGRTVGPPLGIRSMTATCDDAVLLANVHVGGIARSTDGGRSWRPTIRIDADVHQVSAHPTRPEIVIAAAAAGLCMSRDGGETWAIDQRGLHASYCSAVAFSGDDLLVAAATDHFAAQGAVYRRPIDGTGALSPVGSGLPRWLEGIADTQCIAAGAAHGALVDRGGCLYVSDAQGVWTCRTTGLPVPSSVLVC